MNWMPIESAPQDGTPVIYPWSGWVISTCVWLPDSDQPGWWDVRAEEQVFPTHWAPVLVPQSVARDVSFSIALGGRASDADAVAIAPMRGDPKSG